MWTPDFACPRCAAPLGSSVPDTCGACGGQYGCRLGILRFLPTRPEGLAVFLAQYRAVRRADGHVATSLERFRALPDAGADDPNAAEWRIRRQSFRTFLDRVCGRSAAGLRVLDVGAGCGWLAHRMARLGAAAVAVDVNDDGEDGLGVVARAGGPGLTLVQADFDALPFTPHQFDAVVLNASLHYAPDPVSTLVRVARMVAAGGALVVMDSPMFVRADDGRLMVREHGAAIASAAGVATAVRPGPGFLTFEQLRDAADHVCLRPQFIASDGPLAWRVRRAWSGWRLGRAPAAFGVWVAR
ncbi:MAG: class I SAM-dependent methyltransferase [Vicinamibacterales bacterium]